MESDIGSVHSSQSYVVEEIPANEATVPMETEPVKTSDTPLQPKEEQAANPPTQDPEILDENIKPKLKTVAKTTAVIAAAKTVQVHNSWLGMSSDTWFWLVLVIITVAGVLILYFVQRWWTNRQTAQRDAHRKKIREEMASTIIMDLDKEKAVDPMPNTSGVSNPHRTVITKPQPPGTILNAIPKVATKGIETPAPKGFEPKKVTFPDSPEDKTPKVLTTPKSILKPAPITITEQTVKEVEKVTGMDGSWTENDVKQCVHGLQLEDPSLKNSVSETKIVNDCSQKPNLANLIGSVFATPMVIKSMIPKEEEDIEPSKVEEIKEQPQIATNDENTKDIICDDETCPIPVANTEPQTNVIITEPEEASILNQELNSSLNEEKDTNLHE